MAKYADRLEFPASEHYHAVFPELLTPLTKRNYVGVLIGVYYQDPPMFISHALGASYELATTVRNERHYCAAQSLGVGAKEIPSPIPTESQSKYLNTAIGTVFYISDDHGDWRNCVSHLVDYFTQWAAYQLGNVPTQEIYVLGIYTFDNSQAATDWLNEINTLGINTDPSQPYVPLGVPGERTLPGQSAYEQYIATIQDERAKLEALQKKYESQLAELHQYVTQFAKIAQERPEYQDLQDYVNQIVTPISQKLQQEYQESLTKVNELLRKMDTLNSKIAAQAADLQELQDTLSDIRRAQDELAQKVAAIETTDLNASSLEDLVDQLHQLIDQLKATKTSGTGLNLSKTAMIAGALGLMLILSKR